MILLYLVENLQMSVEETECELQQLVSSDEETNQLNNDNVTPPGSNIMKPSASDNLKTTLAAQKHPSEFSYRSNSKVGLILLRYRLIFESITLSHYI